MIDAKVSVMECGYFQISAISMACWVSIKVSSNRSSSSRVFLDVASGTGYFLDHALIGFREALDDGFSNSINSISSSLRVDLCNWL